MATQVARRLSGFGSKPDDTEFRPAAGPLLAGRALEPLGFVSYNAADRAWELTAAGAELLVEHDRARAVQMIRHWRTRVETLESELSYAKDQLADARNSMPPHTGRTRSWPTPPGNGGTACSARTGWA
jgi:hypothetical protein